MSNILISIINLKNQQKRLVREVQSGSNRANDMGEGLETYLKESFANISENDSPADYRKKIEDTFSYEGSKTSIPDLIYRAGDALEIKKKESSRGALQLNSSSPKQKLRADNNKVSQACKQCENWIEKDIFYCIGEVPKGKGYLKSLWLVHGDCYAADNALYDGVEDAVRNSVSDCSGLDLRADTKELGKVVATDPLKISQLRIRGMWTIEHPSAVFRDIVTIKPETDFQLFCILKSNKFNSFNQADIDAVEKDPDITVSSVKIKNPDNAAAYLDAKLITFTQE